MPHDKAGKKYSFKTNGNPLLLQGERLDYVDQSPSDAADLKLH